MLETLSEASFKPEKPLKRSGAKETSLGQRTAASKAKTQKRKKREKQKRVQGKRKRKDTTEKK